MAKVLMLWLPPSVSLGRALKDVRLVGILLEKSCTGWSDGPLFGGDVSLAVSQG